MITDRYEIINTDDGSHTVHIADSDITFHSIRGAIQESQHVFIEAGLKYFIDQDPAKEMIKVFEMGFGTGLNALLTAKEAQGMEKEIEYHAIDLHPLDFNFFFKLNYAELINDPELYGVITQAAWNQLASLSPFFQLEKITGELQTYSFNQVFDIIYFDAFAPDDQPELWTEEIFEKIYGALDGGGVFVTYCSKSAVRKALAAVGFDVEKLPGPPGKREMIRARKL